MDDFDLYIHCEEYFPEDPEFMQDEEEDEEEFLFEED